MEVNTGDEEGGSKKVKLTLSHDDEQFGLLCNLSDVSVMRLQRGK